MSEILLEWSKEENGQGDVRGRWKYCDRSTVTEIVLFLALLVKKRIQTLHKIILYVTETRGFDMCL